MRGATLVTASLTVSLTVSIHAPHARGDFPRTSNDSASLGFNPRPSCEGRPGESAAASLVARFQSTPLMRGATGVLPRREAACVVSIHAPHARGDFASPRPCRRTPRFNPRPSCEGRLPPANSIDKSHVFQSTPLMRGATSDSSYGTPIELVSIHAPHARGDMRYWRVVARSQVSIHAPHARGDNFFSCALA